MKPSIDRFPSPSKPGSSAGFSLIEVALALTVIVFAVTALMGLFPIGLDFGRRAALETRGSHIANIIFSKLRTPPFTAVELFGKDGRKIDLSKPDLTPTLSCFVEYEQARGTRPNDALAAPRITEFSSAQSVYEVRMTLAPVTSEILTPGSATEVTLILSPLNPDRDNPEKGARFRVAQGIRFSTIIGGY